MSGKEKEMPESEELRQVLKVMSAELPTMLSAIVPPLKELMGLSMTEGQAKDKAKAIAAFYKELTASGIDKETAEKLVERQFVTPLDVFKSSPWFLATIKKPEQTESESRKE